MIMTQDLHKIRCCHNIYMGGQISVSSQVQYIKKGEKNTINDLIIRYKHVINHDKDFCGQGIRICR